MPNPGDQIGDFELIREIGRGAVGVVWEAKQASLDRTVAIKFLTSDGGGDPTWKERFRSEAGKAAKLSHPGILPVYALGELDDGQPWFAMELVSGKDLADVLADDGPIEQHRAAGIIRDAARALHHAHENGIVHRDVKPANLMLRDDGRVVVTDFGLSKQLGSGTMTTTGLLVGTPYYMSPEAVSGEKDAVGPKSDVYGLGVTLYELLIGRPPIQAPTPVALIKKIVEEYPPPPKDVLPVLDKDLDTIVMAAMAKDPERRPESAAALADELDRYLAGESIVTKPVTTGERVAHAVSKNKLAVGIGVGALFAIVAAILIFTALLSDKDEELQEKEGEIAELDAALDELRDQLTESGEIRAGLEGDPAEREAAQVRFARNVQTILRRLTGMTGRGGPKSLDRWKSETPASLSIKTTPADAEVELIGLPHRPAFESVTMPATDLEVPAGLYRIVARSQGHNTTIATVILSPSSSGEIELTLPDVESETLGMNYYAGLWAVPPKPGRGPKLLQRFDKLAPYFLDRRVEMGDDGPAMMSVAEARALADDGSKRLPTEREFWNAVLLAPLAPLAKGVPVDAKSGEIDAVLAREDVEQGLLPIWGLDQEGEVRALYPGRQVDGAGGRKPRRPRKEFALAGLRLAADG